MGPFPWQQLEDDGAKRHTEGQKQIRTDPVPVLHVRSSGLGLSTATAPVSQTALVPPYLQDPELRNLDRTVEVFEKIEMEPHMSFKLPKPGATAGCVLEHGATVFEALHKKHSPMTFKFGITHCAHFRWFHRPYGYRYGVEKFEHMLILYAASNPFGPAFLEASMVQRYSSAKAAHQKQRKHSTLLHGNIFWKCEDILESTVLLCLQTFTRNFCSDLHSEVGKAVKTLDVAATPVKIALRTMVLS